MLAVIDSLTRPAKHCSSHCFPTVEDIEQGVDQEWPTGVSY